MNTNTIRVKASNPQLFASQTEQAVRGQIGDDVFNRMQSNRIFPFAQTK